jgi:hypothetical protein
MRAKEGGARKWRTERMGAWAFECMSAWVHERCVLLADICPVLANLDDSNLQIYSNDSCRAIYSEKKLHKPVSSGSQRGDASSGLAVGRGRSRVE